MNVTSKNVAVLLLLCAVIGCPAVDEDPCPEASRTSLTLIVHGYRSGSREEVHLWSDEGKASSNEARLEIRKIDTAHGAAQYLWFRDGRMDELGDASTQTAIALFIVDPDEEPDRDLVIHVFREDDLDRELLELIFWISGVARSGDRELIIKSQIVIIDSFMG